MRFRPFRHNRRRLILLGGERGPAITLNGQSIAEDASVGDLVGLLSIQNSPLGVTWTFTATLNDYFELDAGDDTRVEVKAALVDGSHPLEITATPSVGDAIVRTFLIVVTNVVIVDELPHFTLLLSA